LPARRTRSKLVRLTPEEFAEIEQRAKATGQLPARYLRNAGLAGVAPAPPCNLAIPELLHALGTIGADLKALARSAADVATCLRAECVLGELVSVLQQLTTEHRSS
jgi:hypothetical protein